MEINVVLLSGQLASGLLKESQERSANEISFCLAARRTYTLDRYVVPDGALLNSAIGNGILPLGV
jgi:hypothetical protein